MQLYKRTLSHSLCGLFSHLANALKSAKRELRLWCVASERNTNHCHSEREEQGGHGERGRGAWSGSLNTSSLMIIRTMTFISRPLPQTQLHPIDRHGSLWAADELERCLNTSTGCGRQKSEKSSFAHSPWHCVQHHVYQSASNYIDQDKTVKQEEQKRTD